MAGVNIHGVFSWYDSEVRNAYPPKSVLLLLGLPLLLICLPAAGFWLLDYYAATKWLASVVVLLLVCLLFDVLLTYRRYKSWVREWLCGICHQVFEPEPTHEIDQG